MTLAYPGFVDVHVHFRDPGMPGAETTASGLEAARLGGFAAVVTMPNTTPACDSPEMIAYQLSRSTTQPPNHPTTQPPNHLTTQPLNHQTTQPPNHLTTQPPNHLTTQPPNHLTTQPPNHQTTQPILLPSACITKGRAGREVADLEALAEAGAAFFTDDGSYVADDRVMEEAMRRAAKLGICVCDHAMDPKELGGGVIRDCALARAHGLPVIPVSTETAAIRRDISICRVTGCRLHIQHISTAEGVSLVRDAQREGLPVTAEATPHHLVLSCDEIPADDANYKMAPPLGNGEDRAELRRAVKDGVLMFATDHAPHPADRKSLGFAASANGIIGLETAIPLTWRAMVEEEGMSPDAWARAWWEMPRAILSANAAKRLDGARQTTIVVGERRVVDVEKFASLSRNCPYGGMVLDCWPQNYSPV